MELVERAVAHPRRVLLAAIALALAAALAAGALTPSAPTSLLADGDSAVGSATSHQERTFGGEPIVVDVAGEIEETLTAENLTRLFAMERRLARIEGVQTVFGPGTFLNQAVEQINSVIARELGPPAKRADRAARRAVASARARGVDRKRAAQLGEAARKRALAPQRDQLQQVFLRFGYVGLPALTNRAFVQSLVLGSGVEPKPRFAWLFPSRGHSLVLIRPRAGLSDGRLRAIGREIDRVVAGARLQHGLTTRVAGPPLVAAQLTEELSHELLRLAPVVVLALMLALLIGLRLRGGSLLLLAPAGGAVLLTAALSWLLGLGLTPATVGALPVVLGLAVDYAVQLRARYWTERLGGAPPREAAVQATRAVGPTLLLAGGAMAAGFLALTLSPVPLVDRLGITLAVGVACSLLTTLLFAPPLLPLRDRAGTAPLHLSLRRPRGRARVALLPALRLRRRSRGGAPAALLPAPRLLRRSRGRTSAESPPARRGRARIAALVVLPALGLAGLAVSGSTPIESDLKQLAPGGMEQLDRAEALERSLGTSGQLRVSIRARDVTDPAVLTWMDRVQQRVLAADKRLGPGPNLAALLNAGGGPMSQRSVRQLLGLVPEYFTAAVLSRDRTTAEISFGMPLMPADEQADAIDRIRPLLADAPDGVRAEPAGLVAQSAASVRGLEDERPWLLLLTALVIAALLWAARRRLDRALTPVAPALLAAGLVALLVKALGIGLSPLSAALDPLVLAVGVEFGLLLEARYREELRAGATPAAAARLAAERVGAPVAVAAATVACGFGVLAVSRFEVLVQFGLLAAFELAVCAVASIALVPALAAASDRRRARAAAARSRAVTERPSPGLETA